jgi:CheY-like chemotaxis protein
VLQLVNTESSVLLVNHSPEARQLGQALLAREGVVALTAGNAFEALFHLGAHPIGAIVCEADLPGRDSRWLKARVDQLYPGTAFIISSSRAGVEWERAVREVLPPPRAPLVMEPDPQSGFTRAERERQWTGTDRRGAPRYQPALPLRVALQGGREGLVHDLSRMGAAIDTELHLGPRLSLHVRFDRLQAIARATVEVVRCEVVAVRVNGLTYRAGVIFRAPISEADVQVLLGSSATEAACVACV